MLRPDQAMMSVEQWQKLFQSTGQHIFEVIRTAIIVAASDFPDEFAARRDSITETLYTFRPACCPRCIEVERADMPLPLEDKQREEITKMNKVSNKEDTNKTVKNNEIVPDDKSPIIQMKMSQSLEEVLKMKGIILSQEDQSEEKLLESLRLLQQMQLSLKTLEASGIGMAVNKLKEQNNEQIRDLARKLVKCWKTLVDQHFHKTKADVSTARNRNSNRPPTPPINQTRDSSALNDFRDGRTQKLTNEDKPNSGRQENEELTANSRLENAKRKLREGYQQVQTAKRQRNIHILELCDLPKSARYQKQIKVQTTWK